MEKVEGEFIELQLMNRKITVYLPKEYLLFPEKYFPAVFVHDGDFLFKGSIHAIEQNVSAGVTKPVVFIGIDSENRNDEYTPWEHEALFSTWNFGGKGENYLEFVYKMVVPYIQQHFRISRVAKDLALGGVSLGGLISLYAMYKEANIFKNFILISASVWFTNFVKFMESSQMESDIRVYVYVGEKEGIHKTNIQKHMVQNSKIVYSILQNTVDCPLDNLHFEIDPLGTHEDPYFLQAFPNSISFLFSAIEK